MFNRFKNRTQCYKTIAIILMVNYSGKKLTFRGFKYRGNLLAYCSNSLSFQGKFNLVIIPMVIYSKMAVNYHGSCIITLDPGAYVIKHLLG
jgi:hypothetical protein